MHLSKNFLWINQGFLTSHFLHVQINWIHHDFFKEKARWKWSSEILLEKYRPSEAEKLPPEEVPVFYLKASGWQKVQAMV